MATQRLRRSSKATMRRSRACMLGVALAVSVAGCSAQGPLHHTNSVKRHVNSLGCYVGTFRLHISPTGARPGQIVTLAANGPRRDGGVGTSSWGLLGTTSNGHFAAAYNLAVIIPGSQHQRNIPAGSGVLLAGVGLSNRAFRVEVPPVPSGNYMIQFAYSVVPGLMGNTGAGPRSYTLCARLHVNP